LGEDVESELRKALDGSDSPEVGRRIESLLESLRHSPHPDRLRELRGVWTLSIIGTPAAADMLAALAKGNPEAQLTREAKATLDRLPRQ
jgi:hypothetical protein